MKKIIHKRKVLKRWVRISIFVFLILSVIFASYLIYFAITPKKTESFELFNYEIKNKIDYKVYLKEKDLNENQYIGMNQAYVTNDIDYIDVRYNFNFNGSKDSKVDYTYNIIATLIIDYENNEYGKQVLYSKDYILLEPKSGEFESTTSFGLSDRVEINYDLYNEIINEYKKEKKINVTARLEVKMQVLTNGILTDGTPYSYTDNILLKIPLSETVMMISTDYKESDTGSIKSQIEILNDEIQLIPITIGGTVLITSLILLVYLSKTVIFVSVKSEYRKNLDRILKEYSEIIVEVTSSIEHDDLTIIDIKEFDDMIDLEQEYKSPILHYEKIHGYESWFVIIKDNFMYRYIFKAD